jgi:hypothetical protein
VVVAVVALPAAPRAAAARCTVTDVFYDVTAIRLDERMTAHWDYYDEDGDPASRSSVDTVLTGSVDWHQDHGSRAERKRKRQWAFFEELSGACRVPNFRQGEIHGTAPEMSYHVTGAWSAGGQSGTCSGDRISDRSVTGLFIRHSTKTAPPPATGYGKWTMGGPPVIDCPFMAAAIDGSGLVARHLRRYALRYPGVETPVSKSSLLRRKVVRLPVHVRGDGHPRPGALTELWDDGKVTASLTLDGSVTLTRYSTVPSGPARRAP